MLSILNGLLGGGWWVLIGIGGLGHMAVTFAATYGCDVTAFTSSESKFDEGEGFRGGSRRLEERLDGDQQVRRQL